MHRIVAPVPVAVTVRKIVDAAALVDEYAFGERRRLVDRDFVINGLEVGASTKTRRV